MISSGIRNGLYLDHLVLTVSDVARTKEFYTKIFGAPDKADDYSMMFQLSETKLFFVLPYGALPPNDRFTPNRVGLEHVAVGIRSVDDLREVERVLTKASILHSGIHIDRHSRKEKIWLDDPDGIRLEFYIRH